VTGADPLNTKYLIVGNSAGGIGAAEAIREADKWGSVTIISDEPYPSLFTWQEGERPWAW
jgi:hypothetical protein